VIKYKVFCFEVEEIFGMFYLRIYYNGTQAHYIKSNPEAGAIRKAEQWVDERGYEWLGVEL
jgi:hypothetical protein